MATILNFRPTPRHQNWYKFSRGSRDKIHAKSPISTDRFVAAQALGLYCSVRFSSSCRASRRRSRVSTSTRSRVGFAALTAGLMALTTMFVAMAGGALEAQRATAPANGVITGVVRSPQGPEAGVWVIAETKDLPTNFI